MRKTKLFILALISFALSSGNIFAQVVGDYGSAASGTWSTAATWVVCVADGTWVGATVASTAPTATTNVWILNGHTVNISSTGALGKTVTVQNGGILTSTGNNLTATTFAIEDGGYYSQAGSSTTIPGTTKNFANNSTFEYNGSMSGMTYYTYGNLIWNSSAVCGIPQGNTLTVNGNLTLKGVKGMRGNSSTTGTNTHTVYGNVSIDGTGVYLSGVNNSASTTATNTWNIKGNVSVTNGGRIQVFESAGPHTSSSTSTYNIDGDLSIGTGASLSFRSSTTVNASAGIGTVNVKGNVTNSGSISSTTGATGGTALTVNLIGTAAQQWTGALPAAFATGQSCTVKVNNAAGVVLNSAATVNGNVTLNLTDGKLTIGDNNLTVGSGTLTGGSSTSYIVAEGAGTLIQNATAGADKSFPIGTSSAYTPAKVNPATTSNFAMKMTSSPGAAPANTLFNADVWDIFPTTASATVLTLTASSVAATNDYAIYHWNGGSYDKIVGTLSGNDYTATVSSFSPFTTGGATTPTGNIENEVKNVYFDGVTIHNPENTTIQLYDVTGRIVVKSNNNIDMTGKTKGVYIVKNQNTTFKIKL